MISKTSTTSYAKNMVALMASLTWLVSPVFTQQTGDTTRYTTAVNTSKIWGTVDGMSIEGLVQGPSAATTPLQIACVFEYTEGDIFNSPPALPKALNGMVHLDEALNGIITDVRKNGRFSGHAFETLLITPPAGALKTPRLLLIGLGDRNAFTPEMMKAVGMIALREAIKAGVSRFAFAGDLKDAGIDSPTALIAANVTRGIVEAYRTQQYLKSKHMAAYKPIGKVTLLAGPAFFTTAGKGIQEAIGSFNN